MILRNRLKTSTLLRIGLLSFVAASLLHFLHPSATLPAYMIAAAQGLLYGISIPFLMCVLYRRRKGSASKAGRSS
jgi:predicted membrane-bound spermidine synthase